MKQTREVLIERILPNPMRDFNIYPMHSERIELLAKSYGDRDNGGDFGTIIPVRPHPTREGFYQQACGHHRVATMKEAGRLRVLCQIADRDDDEMASIMVRENMVNYGNNAEALADSVAAICKVLSYKMFLAATLDEWGGSPPRSAVFTTKTGYKNARKHLIEEGAIGHKILHKWITKGATEEILKLQQVKDAVEHLNSTGDMQRIIGVQRTRAQAVERLAKKKELALVAAAEEARAKAEREAELERQAVEAAKEARREALEAKQEAERIAKEAADEAARIQAERMAAEAEAAYMAERVEEAKRRRRQKALDKLAEEEAKREEEKKQKLAKHEANAEKLDEAQDNADNAEHVSYIHRQIINIITRPEHLIAFRNIVAEHPDVFPMDMQVGYARSLVTHHGQALTAGKIKTAMMSLVEAAKAEVRAANARVVEEARRALAEAQAEEERHNKIAKADRLAREGSAVLGRLAAWMRECDDATKDREVMEAFLKNTGGVAVMNHLHALEDLLPRLRKLMHVEARGIRAGDIDGNSNVIDIQ